MIPEIQKVYEQNRPQEVMGKRPLSAEFFRTWQEEGLIPAFHGVYDFVKSYGHTDHITAKALGIILGSSILTFGNLTQYVEMLRANVSDNDYSLSQKIALGLYGISVGMIMTGHSEETSSTTSEDDGYIKRTTTRTTKRWGGYTEHTDIDSHGYQSYFDQE